MRVHLRIATVAALTLGVGLGACTMDDDGRRAARQYRQPAVRGAPEAGGQLRLTARSPARRGRGPSRTVRPQRRPDVRGRRHEHRCGLGRAHDGAQRRGVQDHRWRRRWAGLLDHERARSRYRRARPGQDRRFAHLGHRRRCLPCRRFEGRGAGARRHDRPRHRQLPADGDSRVGLPGARLRHRGRLPQRQGAANRASRRDRCRRHCPGRVGNTHRSPNSTSRCRATHAWSSASKSKATT